MSCHAIGALSLPLIVNCSIACELSDPCGSFETFLTHSCHTSSNGFSHGQLCWNTSVKLVAPVSRPNLFSQTGPSPCSIFRIVFTHNHFGSSSSVCRKHRVQHSLSVSCRICDDFCCDPLLPSCSWYRQGSPASPLPRFVLQLFPH